MLEQRRTEPAYQCSEDAGRFLCLKNVPEGQRSLSPDPISKVSEGYKEIAWCVQRQINSVQLRLAQFFWGESVQVAPTSTHASMSI